MDLALAAADADRGVDAAFFLYDADGVDRAKIRAGAAADAQGCIRQLRFKIGVQVKRKNAAVVGAKDSATIPAAVANRQFRIMEVFILMENLVHGAPGLHCAHQVNCLCLRNEPANAVLHRVPAKSAHSNTGLRWMIKAAGLVDHLAILPAEAMYHGDAIALPLLFKERLDRLRGINFCRLRIDRLADRNRSSHAVSRSGTWRQDALKGHRVSEAVVDETPGWKDIQLGIGLEHSIHAMREFALLGGFSSVGEINLEPSHHHAGQYVCIVPASLVGPDKTFSDKRFKKDPELAFRPPVGRRGLLEGVGLRSHAEKKIDFFRSQNEIKAAQHCVVHGEGDFMAGIH